jgi:U6 snRNA-associated Sm-like protein LSm1
VLVVLRDGRHLVGLMRSFDQFSNFVLEDTSERWYVGDMYGDVRLGLYVLRGENVVMLGELGTVEEEAAVLSAKGLRRVSADAILEAKAEDARQRPGFTDWKTFDEIEGPSS